MRRGLAAALAAVMVITAVPSAATAQESDFASRGEVVQLLMEAADDYNPQIKKTDIIKGYGDGKLHEEDTVTRAQAVIMLNRAFGGFPELKGNSLRLAIPKETFTDIPAWAEEELAPAFEAGIVAGTGEGLFSPDHKVTTEQMRLFIQRVYAIYGTNPKDSFYSSVNKKALDTLQIPEGSNITGTAYAVRDRANQQVLGLIGEISGSTPEKDTPEEKIKILYDNFMDMEARNAAGIAPIAEDLRRIDAVRSVSELDDVMIQADSRSALSLLTDFTLTIDEMDSGRYLTLLEPASAELTKQVYSGESEVQKKAYLKYISSFLTLCGEAKEEAQKNAQDFFAFEKQLSDASLTIAEQYDPGKTYNIYTLNELKKIFSDVDIQRAFDETGLSESSRIKVSDRGNMTELAGMLTDANLAAVKNYLKVRLIVESSEYLSEDFRNTKVIYEEESLGKSGSKPLNEEAAEVIAEVLPDYVGQIYAERYCSDEIISDVTNMVHDIIGVYRKRISNLSWMSEVTKQKAIRKLNTMRIKVGAPDYSKVKPSADRADLKSRDEGGSYYQNRIEIAKAERMESARLSKETVDREEWITTPQTVNAFYMPSFNSVNFPAAFLQAPIYDPEASYEENLGGIGTVIGHEVTHAFDSGGAQYDENGNIADWWTQEDKEAFGRLGRSRYAVGCRSGDSQRQRRRQIRSAGQRHSRRNCGYAAEILRKITIPTAVFQMRHR